MTLETIRDADLALRSTFALPARALELVELRREDQLAACLDTDLDLLLLGGGSNTVFVRDYEGRVVLNRLEGLRFEPLDDDRVRVDAAAGEDWHRLVTATLDRGLWGIENLALIPGDVGAAPMQNIGAYGVELADVLDAVRVHDRETGTRRWIDASECDLGYRSSRFRNSERFVILAVRMVLSRSGRARLHYPALAEAVRRRNGAACDPETLTPRDVADAVIDVRTRKLPDPDRLANAGSFFKNPVVPSETARQLAEAEPGLPVWDNGSRSKLSAAWMIDQLGWRGRSVGGACVYPDHALVLTNTGGATAADLLALARSIRDSVEDRFGLRLEPEPRLVGEAL